MRHVYLVQAHADEAQLAALLHRLTPAGTPDRSFLHIDAGSPLWRKTRGRFVSSCGAATALPQPVRVRWGHSSQLAATRRLLRAALADPFDVAHLLSGADWPLVQRERLLAETSDGRCHIEAQKDVQAERMGARQLDSRWLRADPTKPLDRYAARTLRTLSALLPERRATPWGPWHKGSQWWSLPRDACAAVLVELDRAFTSGVLRGSVCSDEHFIQTVVAQRFGGRLADPMRFIRWEPAMSSPKVLTRDDWPDALASGAWFARKVSRAVDPFFLDC